jgi:hypothetical protein
MDILIEESKLRTYAEIVLNRSRTADIFKNPVSPEEEYAAQVLLMLLDERKEWKEKLNSNVKDELSEAMKALETFQKSINKIKLDSDPKPALLPKPDERLADVKFLVEANDFEYSALYLRHSYRRETPDPSRVKWDDELSGYAATAGYIGGLPVVIALRFAKLNGQRVCFYHATSRAVDYQMVEAYLNSACPHLNDKRCDATNFGHCLQAVRGDDD